MFEKFDNQAQEVINVAGNMAAARKRRRSRRHQEVVTGLEIGVQHIKDALRVVAPRAGYTGGFTPAAQERFDQLAGNEVITAEDLRRVFFG